MFLLRPSSGPLFPGPHTHLVPRIPHVHSAEPSFSPSEGRILLPRPSTGAAVAVHVLDDGPRHHLRQLGRAVHKVRGFLESIWGGTRARTVVPVNSLFGGWSLWFIVWGRVGGLRFGQCCPAQATRGRHFKRTTVLLEKFCFDWETRSCGLLGNTSDVFLSPLFSFSEPWSPRPIIPARIFRIYQQFHWGN